MLQATGEFVVIGEASETLEVFDLLETGRPDVVLLIIEGAGEREFALIAQLPNIAERACVLVVTPESDSELHTRAVELGAMGVVLKDQTAEVLTKALHKVCDGEIWLDRARTSGVLKRLTRRTVEVDPEVAKVQSLTRRERQIVTLVTEGLTNKDVADRLYISEATARNHLTSILDKLDLDDRFQLTVYAFRRGLVLCPQTPAMLRVAATMTSSYPDVAPARSISPRAARSVIPRATSDADDALPDGATSAVRLSIVGSRSLKPLALHSRVAGGAARWLDPNKPDFAD
jgi:DNA-binding NarL/FixJ family response regulator